MKNLQSVKGTKDLLPHDTLHWREVESIIHHSDGVKSFILKPLKPCPDFKPGQFLDAEQKNILCTNLPPFMEDEHGNTQHTQLSR